MFEKVKNYIIAAFQRSRAKTLTVAAVAASAILYVTLTSEVGISSLGIGLFRYIAIVIVTWLVQEFAFPEINTLQIFKEKPYAYIAFVIAHIIAAALCFSCSV